MYNIRQLAKLPDKTAFKMDQKSTSEISLDVSPVQREGLSLDKTPCCFYVRDTENDIAVRLNSTGVLIWQVCTGDWSVGEIIEVLEENYPDAAATMHDDVMRTLNQLLEEDIIELKAA